MVDKSVVTELLEKLESSLAADNVALTQEASAAKNQGSYPLVLDPIQLPAEAYGSTTKEIFKGNDGSVEEMIIVNVNGIRVRDRVAPSLAALLLEVSQTPEFRVVEAESSFRTRAKQQQLYDKYKKCLLESLNPETCTLAAVPGSVYANHERGLSIDFKVNGVSRGPLLDQLEVIAAKHGFVRTEMPKEPWHFEWKGVFDGITKLPVTKARDDALASITKQLTDINPASFRALLYEQFDKHSSTDRRSRIINQTRKDYVTAQFNFTEQRQSRYDAQASQVAANMPILADEEIPTVDTSFGFLFDFEKGEWTDGKTGGIPRGA